MQIAKERNIPVILLIGRPYHIDPEINHGIPEMIQSYNLAIVSEDSVYHMDTPEDKLYIVNQWSYHARLYHAASFAAAHPEINLIQLSSFGCGLDAITTNQVREIMEGHQRLYTCLLYTSLLICSSWLFILTLEQGGTDMVINVLPPITESWPMTVSPPRMEAPE